MTRTQAAIDAGLSERQRKTALRVAAVPAAEFETAIEGANPPTVTALAERGTKHLFREATAEQREALYDKSSVPLRHASEAVPSLQKAGANVRQTLNTFVEAIEAIMPEQMVEAIRSCVDTKNWTSKADLSSSLDDARRASEWLTKFMELAKGPSEPQAKDKPPPRTWKALAPVGSLFKRKK